MVDGNPTPASCLHRMPAKRITIRPKNRLPARLSIERCSLHAPIEDLLLASICQHSVLSLGQSRPFALQLRQTRWFCTRKQNFPQNFESSAEIRSELVATRSDLSAPATDRAQAQHPLEHLEASARCRFSSSHAGLGFCCTPGKNCHSGHGVVEGQARIAHLVLDISAACR